MTGELKLNPNFSKTSIIPNKYSKLNDSKFSKSQILKKFNQTHKKANLENKNESIFEANDGLKKRFVRVYNITSKDDVHFKSNSTYTDLKKSRDFFIKMNKGDIEGCIEVPQCRENLLDAKNCKDLNIRIENEQLMRENKNSRIFVLDINKTQSQNLLRNVKNKDMNYHHNKNIDNTTE